MAIIPQCCLSFPIISLISKTNLLFGNHFAPLLVVSAEEEVDYLMIDFVDVGSLKEIPL
jgi:hypothetical protein